MSALGEAAALLQAEAARLTALLRDRGYPKSHIEIWVGRNGADHFTAYVEGAPLQMPFVNWKRDIDDLITETEAAIAKAPDAKAYEAWFAMPQADAAA